MKVLAIAIGTCLFFLATLATLSSQGGESGKPIPPPPPRPPAPDCPSDMDEEDVFCCMTGILPELCWYISELSPYNCQWCSSGGNVDGNGSRCMGINSPECDIQEPFLEVKIAEEKETLTQEIIQENALKFGICDYAEDEDQCQTLGVFRCTWCDEYPATKCVNEDFCKQTPPTWKLKE